MRFNVVSYLIKEGLRNVFKNKKSTISSLMIMCATMLIFGLFFVIGENVTAFVNNVEEAQGITVFILEKATEEEEQKLGQQLLEIEGVKSAEYVSKIERLESLVHVFGEDIVKGYRDQPEKLPASYDVTFTDLELNEEVQEKILQLENVKKIEASNKKIELVIKLANGARILTGALLILLIIISVSIISNTIKLTVHARRKEISIMKYVGATNSFIRWPFLVEGIVIGVMAGMLSVVLVGGVYTLIANYLNESTLMLDVQWKLLEFSTMLKLIIVVYFGLGIGIGTVGSSISMKKYLEV